MLIYLTSSSSCCLPRHNALVRLRELASLDQSGRYLLTDNPEKADIILFAEGIGSRGHERRLVRSPLVQRFPQRCFCCIEHDDPIHILPGLYTTPPQGVLRFLQHTANGGYLVQYPNEFVTYERPIQDDDRLFGFVGSLETADVRRGLVALSHPRGVVKDMTSEARANRDSWSADERARFRQSYAQELTRCKFILCPRGLSPSSVRMYEAMRAGRVPVILSDAWVPPSGPDWGSFSVRLAEREVANLPDILNEIEPKAREMGALARRAWQQWFADDVRFDRTLRWIEQIAEARRLPSHLERLSVVIPRYTTVARQKSRSIIRRVICGRRSDVAKASLLKSAHQNLNN